MIQFDDVFAIFFQTGWSLKPPTDDRSDLPGGFEADDARTSWIRYLDPKGKGEVFF